jgi:UDP-3-O-[3-hydroxymyristoyl] glucosamine N-acyltransferase
VLSFVAAASVSSCEDATAILVNDPHVALRSVLLEINPASVPSPGIHPTAVIAPSATVDPQATVGPFAVVGEETEIGARTVVGAHVVIGSGCCLGRDVVLHPHVTLYERVTVLDRAIIHSGARIGKDGFGYVWQDGGHRKIPQIGGCIVEEDVEIGANVCVDRGSIGDTVIGAGTKIDNLVQLGHNVRLGKHVILVSQVGISGSTSIGDGAVLGGQAGVGGHLTIGPGARIGAQGGVTADVPGGESYSGYPARPHRDALRVQAATFKLPDLLRRFKRLEAAVFGDDSSRQ